MTFQLLDTKVIGAFCNQRTNIYRLWCLGGTFFSVLPGVNLRFKMYRIRYSIKRNQIKIQKVDFGNLIFKNDVIHDAL
jgi:hypothetical protein